ncbi:hypothetical protein N7501_008536 [Penicillium viridicatum]|nr:hypothetical protein N7501_008536 [Penicillium viridicatum]
MLDTHNALPSRNWPKVTSQEMVGGYLTHSNGSDVVYGPITVVAGGDAPFHMIVENLTYRDVFYDAPLGNLTFPTGIAAYYNKLMDPTYNPSNSYYASTDFRKAIGSLYLGRLSDAQLAILRSQIHAAHELGLKARY